MAQVETQSGISDPVVGSALRELGRKLSERFGRKYVKIMLFGSRARGDNHAESDADVAVVLRGRITNRWSLKRLIIQDTYLILLETGLYIQAWPLEEGELDDPDESSNPTLLWSVVRDGITL
jgi:predicted nucleotidyltransferase